MPYKIPPPDVLGYDDAPPAVVPRAAQGEERLRQVAARARQARRRPLPLEEPQRCPRAGVVLRQELKPQELRRALRKMNTMAAEEAFA